MSTRKPARPFTLRDAHAEYLPQINMCECPLCRAVNSARCTCALCMMSAHCWRYDHVAYTRALSDRLLALVNGEHSHVTLAEYVRATFTEEERSRPIRQPDGYRIGRDDRATGLGIGIGGRIGR